MKSNSCTFTYFMCYNLRKMRFICQIRSLLLSIGSIPNTENIIAIKTSNFIIRKSKIVMNCQALSRKLFWCDRIVSLLVDGYLTLFNFQYSNKIIMIPSFSPTKLAQCIFHRSFHMFSVRVRYAPSPTGFMHVGGLRTALFNYLFAKKNKGQFIIRIQDTDKNRQVEGSIQNIFESLQWIGVVADESIKNGGQFGPYIQGQRLLLYKSVQKQLLKKNMAYPCFCKHQDKKQQQQVQQSHGYDGKCRSLSFQQIKKRIIAKQEYAVRIKSDLIPLPKTFKDQVFGQLQFKQLDDFVIVRSNGWPTFHLANVIDDWKMGITHVMRGQQWLTNTNKHVYLYQVLGATPPKFVHLPLIKAMNGKKLAKRDPSSSVKFFQNGKYEVQAVKCFLAQMGLNRVNHQTQQTESEPQALKKQNIQEKSSKKSQNKQKKQQQNLKLLTDGDMIDNFDISRITKVPVKFDIKQLDFLNRLALKKRWKLAQSFQSQMQYFISKTNQLIPSSKNYSKQYIKKFVSAVIDRFSYITDISLYKYYFQQPNYFEQASKQDLKKIYGKDVIIQQIKDTIEGEKFRLYHIDPLLYQKNRKVVHHLRILFEHVIQPQAYCQLQILKKISDFLFQSPDLKNEQVYHLLRFMVSGRKSGPNITLACELIGREKILNRLAAFSSI